MTSVLYNAAATTALRVLQSTNTKLDTVENRISTGLKIGEAKDNAAYWSISTTLKSDNSAMSSVSDALGLGAATVDTAYQGLNSSLDVLNKIKEKLTSATQDGVDRKAVQDEVDALQEQLKSIANSSTFSGENWLSVNSQVAGYNPTKSVVASFTRDANGSVSIGKIDINTSSIALYDASTVSDSGGILDGQVALKKADGSDLKVGGKATDKGNTSTGGLSATASSDTGVAATALEGTAGAPGTPTATFAFGTFDATGIDTGDTISFNLTGGSATSATAVTVDLTSVTDAATLRTAITNALTTATITGVTVGGTGNAITLSAATDITVAGTTPNNVNADGTTTTTLGLGNGTQTASTGTGTAGELTTGTFTTTGLAEGDQLTFSLTVDGAAEPVVKTITVGASHSVSDIAALLDTAFDGAVDVAEGSTPDTGKLVFKSQSTGAASNVKLNSVVIKDADGAYKVPSTPTGLPTTEAATVSTGTFSALTLDKDDNLSFTIQVDKALAPTTVRIDQALVDSALKDVTGHTSGNIADADQFKTVMEAALKAANVKGVTVGKAGTTGSEHLTFTSETAGADSSLKLSAVNVSQGASTISVDEIDVTSESFTALSQADQADVLAAYISVVNTAISKVTAAASSLGAVSGRIELQQGFVTDLMDTIDKGVSGLVDADMNEESTRLQALQVQQQLGVQALSIANQSAQNVLRLFQ
ncbi:flagellin [Consotaella salsifontis]|uniref:Flagellin n=1 Tax=Consotaella salsifontis TaxID=1365950 RepID=A0A1T4NS13_9HYPH|nr:flagellin [Consotaella salsifontis]SJZ81895.1 Flagellin FlgL [Consotaella salsifontis]